MRRGVRIAGAGAVAVAGLALTAFFMRPTGLATDSADGTFEHDCCGTVVLRGGTMTLGGERSVSYVVGRDRDGPYILPATFVGTWEQDGFEIDGTRDPMKIRLDTLPRPTKIQIADVAKSYVFTRKKPRAVLQPDLERHLRGQPLSAAAEGKGALRGKE